MHVQWHCHATRDLWAIGHGYMNNHREFPQSMAWLLKTVSWHCTHTSIGTLILAPVIADKILKMAKAILVTTLCLCQLLFLFKVELVMSQEVLLHPYSRLVPVGTDVYFTCKVRDAQNPHWIVGRIEANANLHKNNLSAMGIYILDDEQSDGNTTLTLRINSSYSNVNNTQISCTADGTRSETAKLLIIDRKYWWLCMHELRHYVSLHLYRFPTVTKPFLAADKLNSSLARVVISIHLAWLLNRIL